jgi:hypothetical protein
MNVTRARALELPTIQAKERIICVNTINTINAINAKNAKDAPSTIQAKEHIIRRNTK